MRDETRLLTKAQSFLVVILVMVMMVTMLAHEQLSEQGAICMSTLVKVFQISVHKLNIPTTVHDCGKEI